MGVNVLPVELFANGIELPVALFAVILKVYAVPFDKLGTTIGLEEPVTANRGRAATGAVVVQGVIVYPVIAEAPIEAGAMKVKDTWVSPTVLLNDVGAPGAPAVAADVVAAPVPAAFVAVTEKVYAVPVVSPEIL
jgi:hypothetical protein